MARTANAGPHALTAVGDRCFAYDANGNQTAGYNFTKARTRTLTWSAYNKPRTIREGALTLTFDYGADRARIRQVNNATMTTTTYVGNLYEKQVRGTSATHVHYLRAGGQVVALYRAQGRTSTSNPVGTPTSATTRYLHRDHLGSITVITNENQGIVERLAYDAWGKRRPPTAAQTLGRLTSLTTLRGFSGHEMLDTVSLIHMNGRVYDPDLGRFLSADPTIQFPGYSQSYNRYSYVLNNPLSYTDPSGFGILGFFKGLFKGIGKLVRGVARVIRAVARTISRNIRSIAAIGVLFIPGVNAYAAGFASGLVATGGDLKTGLISALTAGAFEWMGGIEWAAHFGEAVWAAKAVAHGVVGGVSSLAHGGSFLSGFAAGGVAQWIGGSKWVRGLDRLGQGVARIVAGGLASLAGGGKFKNGAVTAAFAYVFNELRHREVDYSNCGDGKECVVSNQGVRDELDRLNDQLATDTLGHVSVSGGDSRYNPTTGQSISISTGEVVPGRYMESFHNEGQNHRAVDIRGNMINLSRPDLDQYIEHHTDFKVLDRVYRDEHLHLTCNSPACIDD